MRVLQVTSYFYPHVGGLETYVYNLSKHLVKRGHEVVVYTSNLPKSKHYEVFDGLEIRRFNAFTKPLGNPFTLGMFKSLLNVKGFDIVHAHDEHAFTANLAALTRLINGKPIVISSHGRLSYDYWLGKLLLFLYERTAMRLTLKGAQAVIVLSGSDKEYLSRFGIDPQKIRVIPNALTPFQSNLYPVKEGPEKEYGFEGKHLILYVGQLLRRKGVQYLIDALPKISSAIKDVRLAIVGDGDYKGELMKRVRACKVQGFVDFLGRISNEKLVQMYSKCDVLVLPSLAEGVPNVILEAMSRGKPVIATQIPGITDYFQETAYLVKPSDAESLSEAVIDVLSNNYVAENLGKKGQALLENNFTWSKVADSVLELYNGILNNYKD